MSICAQSTNYYVIMNFSLVLAMSSNTMSISEDKSPIISSTSESTSFNVGSTSESTASLVEGEVYS